MANKTMNVSPAEVEKYLGGISYPVDKQKLIDYAKQKGAPDEVISMLQKMGDKNYNSSVDVTEEFGKIV